MFRKTDMHLIPSKNRFKICGLGFFGAVLTIIVLFATASYAQSGLHTFDAQKLQSVQQIKSALTNTSIDRVISSVRSNLAYLSGKEIEVVAKETKLVRDLAVFAVLTTTNNAVDYLDGQLIEPRLLEILGDTNHVRMASKDISNYEQIRRNVAREVSIFKEVTGQSPPAFSFIKDYPATLDPGFTNKLSPNDALAATTSYSILTNKYTKIKNLYDSYSATGGLLAEVLMQLKTLEESEVEQEKNTESIKKELASAIAAYTNTFNANFSAQTLATNVATLIGSVTNALAQGGPLAKKIGLEVQYNAVNAIISAAASGTISNSLYDPQNYNLSVAVQIASHLPGIVKSASDMVAYANQLPISGLLLNKQLLQLQLDEVNNEIALNEKGREYTSDEVDALILELQSLIKSRQSLIADESLATEFKTNSFRTLLTNTKLDGAKRAALVAAVINYSAAIQIGQQAFYKSQALLVQLEYEKATLASEQSLLQWKALVEMPINQLLDYYGTGFKSDEVAKTVVNALGLAAIAWRL
jgi:hypothetical protein